MKKGKYHILCARILLVCFVTGQCMVYAHQHAGSPAAAKYFAVSGAALPHQNVKEHCDLCDVMLHNAMLASYLVYLKPVEVVSHFYASVDYHLTSIRLILAGGRAPPGYQS